MKRLILIAALVLSLGLLGAGVALAQGGNEEGPVRTFIAKLAARLGVSEDELQGAIADVQKEMLDEAVSEGRLTQEQAERIRQRIDEGGFFFPGRGPGHKPGYGPCARVGVLALDAAAEVLGMERDQLIEELRGGKSLADIVGEQGLSAEEFKSALLAQVRQALDARVAEGKLTQSEADRVFQRVEENADEIVSGSFPRQRPCHDRGHRPHGGRAPEGDAPPGDGE